MYKDKVILSVVMARRGSKGCPNKTVKPLCGWASYLWSVFASIQSEYIDYTVISIANYRAAYREFEAWRSMTMNYPYDSGDKTSLNKTPFKEMPGYYSVTYYDRPEDLNGPKVKNEPVLKDACRYANKELNLDPDYIVCLQSTSPVRYGRLVDSCIETLFESEADSLLTTRKMFPFFWQKNENDNFYNCPSGYFIDRPMRQNLTESDFAHFDNGNVYITNKNILFESNNRLGGNVIAHTVDEGQNLQIDTEEDFHLIDNYCSSRKITPVD
jgi:CMP-N-acetylneuraminic acid synthetase